MNRSEQEICDDWNAQYPVGTEVIFTDYWGKKHISLTGEPAKVVYGKAVVLLSAPILNARYELDRIQPIKKAACPYCGNPLELKIIGYGGWRISAKCKACDTFIDFGEEATLRPKQHSTENIKGGASGRKTDS